VAVRALQLHRIAKVSAKNSGTVLQQQRVQGGLYDRVAGRETECKASDIGHCFLGRGSSRLANAVQ
jgi:hypothetical protein